MRVTAGDWLKLSKRERMVVLEAVHIWQRKQKKIMRSAG